MTEQNKNSEPKLERLEHLVRNAALATMAAGTVAILISSNYEVLQNPLSDKNTKEFALFVARTAAGALQFIPHYGNVLENLFLKNTDDPLYRCNRYQATLWFGFLSINAIYAGTELGLRVITR